jgi:hypothetical protein
MQVVEVVERMELQQALAVLVAVVMQMPPLQTAVTELRILEVAVVGLVQI